MSRFHQFVYLAGYGQWLMPKTVRRVIAGSQLHRAWLLGLLGFFREDDISYGPAKPYVHNNQEFEND